MEPTRIWNLSGLFPFRNHGGGQAWSRTINPAFNAREGEVIALLGSVDPTLVPTVLGCDPKRGRLLLDHVAGQDLWIPSAEEVVAVVPRRSPRGCPRRSRSDGLRPAGHACPRRLPPRQLAFRRNSNRRRGLR
ncbi:hypothetical protein ACWGG3_22310, partial [Streptomyces sp. NPDC054901]